MVNFVKHMYLGTEMEFRKRFVTKIHEGEVAESTKAQKK